MQYKFGYKKMEHKS